MISKQADALLSEIKQLQSILATISADRVIDRYGIELRIAELRSKVEALPDRIQEAEKLALTFRGEPIRGSSAISADFAGKTASAFVDAFAAIVADRRGPHMTLARLIEAVENGQWDHTVAWKVFGIGKTGQAERAFNGSLDAAKRLHDALLPEWVVRLTAGTDQSSFPYVHVFKPRQTEDDPSMGANSSGYRGYDPARAWLLAILRAMEGRDG